MHGPDKVPGIMLAIPSDHAAGSNNTVAHSLKTIENLKQNSIIYSMYDQQITIHVGTLNSAIFSLSL